MRKEMIGYSNGSGRALVFHPSVKSVIQPVIAKTFEKGGIRYYKDSNGRDHVADIYDKVWGKREPRAILPARKGEFQRTFR